MVSVYLDYPYLLPLLTIYFFHLHPCSLMSDNFYLISCFYIIIRFNDIFDAIEGYLEISGRFFCRPFFSYVLIKPLRCLR